MHSAGIAAIPPHDSADIDIAGASLGFAALDKCVHTPFLGARQKMQLAVHHHGFLAAYISFRSAGRRVFCAARLRVRYFDSRHNWGVKVRLGGGVLIPGHASWCSIGTCIQLSSRRMLRYRSCFASRMSRNLDSLFSDLFIFTG